MTVIADQPPPVPSDRPAIADLVIADMHQRKALGVERYGTPLQAHNGRDALIDLYQELLDGCAYVRQVIAERDQPRAGILTWDYRQGPNLDQLRDLVTDLSGGRLHLRHVDADSDEVVIVVLATRPVDQAQGIALWERWEDRGQPDGAWPLDLCGDCHQPVVEQPGKRDQRHDHCGPLPHTGPAGGPYCDRCR